MCPWRIKLPGFDAGRSILHMWKERKGEISTRKEIKSVSTLKMTGSPFIMYVIKNIPLPGHSTVPCLPSGHLCLGVARAKRAPSSTFLAIHPSSSGREGERDARIIRREEENTEHEPGFTIHVSSGLACE